VLKRIYGVEGTVSSLPWKNGLDRLCTIREPHSPMITFRQFLEKLVSAESINGGLARSERTSWSDAWILMDIKVDTSRFAPGPHDGVSSLWGNGHR
jgi:hypothetical protein